MIKGVKLFLVDIELTGLNEGWSSTQEPLPGVRLSERTLNGLLETIPTTHLLSALPLQWTRALSQVALHTNDQWWVSAGNLKRVQELIQGFEAQVDALKRNYWDRQLYAGIRGHLSALNQTQGIERRLIERAALSIVRKISQRVRVCTRTQEIKQVPVKQLEAILKTNFFNAIPWSGLKALNQDCAVPAAYLERFCRVAEHFESYSQMNTNFDRLFRLYCQMCRPWLMHHESFIGAQAREFYRQLSALRKALEPSQATWTPNAMMPPDWTKTSSWGARVGRC